MRQPSPRWWPARHDRLAGLIPGGPNSYSCGPHPRMVRPRRQAKSHPAPAAPLKAPPALRAEEPDAEGVRRGLVAYYQQLIAQGGLDTPERLAAAEELLLDRYES